MVHYKGYGAKIEYSVEDMSYVGHVLGIRDYLSFDGDTIEEAIDMFHDNIDDYLTSA